MQHMGTPGIWTNYPDNEIDFPPDPKPVIPSSRPDGVQQDRISPTHIVGKGGLRGKRYRDAYLSISPNIGYPPRNISNSPDLGRSDFDPFRGYGGILLTQIKSRMRISRGNFLTGRITHTPIGCLRHGVAMSSGSSPPDGDAPHWVFLHG